jgi:catabolite regulation protein CreA
MQIVTGCDAQRNALVYLAHSGWLTGGSLQKPASTAHPCRRTPRE